MVDFQQSETKKNLMRAFAGESQARNRYTLAAGQAKKEKLYVVEWVFNFTAGQEKEHAEIFYKHLAACQGQNIEIDAAYPVDNYVNTLSLLKDSHKNEYEEYQHRHSATRRKARAFWRSQTRFTRFPKSKKHTETDFQSLQILLRAEKCTCLIWSAVGYVLIAVTKQREDLLPKCVPYASTTRGILSERK